MDSVLRKIEHSHREVSTTDEAVQFVERIFEQFRDLVLPEYQTLLSQTDIYVVLQPICNAQADFVTNSIVLFDGLFQVLTFRMELSLLIAEVKKQLDKAGNRLRLAREELPSVAYQAQALSLHFLSDPEPLPKLDEHFDDRLKLDAYVAFAGGLLFILFHELGHLMLKHGIGPGEYSQKVVPALACMEDINYRKSREFEADAFAFQAFMPWARSAVIVNVWYVMNLYLDYESLAGNLLHTHPFTINRVQHLNSLTGALEDPQIGASAQKIFDARLKLMRTRLEAVDPHEHLLSASDRYEINEKAMRSVLGKPEDCRAAVQRLVDAYRGVQTT